MEIHPVHLKALHLLGATLFLGNIIVSAFWKVLADRSSDLSVIRFSTRLVNLTDLAFTGTGATLLVATGHALASAHGGVLAQPWIAWSYGFFAASGLVWLVLLVPIQLRQATLLRDAVAVPAAYRVLARRWAIAGTIATLLALPPVWLMVARSGGFWPAR